VAVVGYPSYLNADSYPICHSFFIAQAFHRPLKYKTTIELSFFPYLAFLLSLSSFLSSWPWPWSWPWKRRWQHGDEQQPNNYN